jgi:hypothetical protein
VREGEETLGDGAANQEGCGEALTDRSHLKGVPCGVCGENCGRMWLKNNETHWLCDRCLQKQILEQRRKQ